MCAFVHIFIIFFLSIYIFFARYFSTLSHWLSCIENTKHSRMFPLIMMMMADNNIVATRIIFVFILWVVERQRERRRGGGEDALVWTRMGAAGRGRTNEMETEVHDLIFCSNIQFRRNNNECIKMTG